MPMQIAEWALFKCGLTWSKLIGGIVATTVLSLVSLDYFYPVSEHAAVHDDDDDEEEGEEADNDGDGDDAE